MGEWVRYKLDQRTDHILVDEAQDTNRDQWEIVGALATAVRTGEPYTSDGGEPDEPLIFLHHTESTWSAEFSDDVMFAALVMGGRTEDAQRLFVRLDAV